MKNQQVRPRFLTKMLAILMICGIVPLASIYSFAATEMPQRDGCVEVYDEYLTNITQAFTDSNFKKAVYKHIGKQATEEILDIDVEKIESLDISNSGIKSLAGLEYFTSLKEFNCRENQITSLPALPSTLEILDCAHNKLKSLPAMPSGLKKLDCSGNQLTAIQIQSGIEQLNCDSNRLTRLPALPSSLINFSCYNNQIKALPTLPSGLIELSCGSNPIESLPKLPRSLTVIFSNNCLLKELDVSGLNLKTLHCEGNYLRKVKGFNGVWDNVNYKYNPQNLAQDKNFIPVTNITGVPATMTIDKPLTLNGKVAPSKATNQNIKWSYCYGSPNARLMTIKNNTFTPNKEGVYYIVAEIAFGSSSNQDYVQYFEIKATKSNNSSNDGDGNIYTNGNVTTAMAKKVAKQAIEAAKKKGSSTAVANIKNPMKITKAALDAMVTEAGKMSIKLQADSMSKDNIINVRITFDPAKAKTELTLSASTADSNAKKTKNLMAKSYKNAVTVVSCGQAGGFGQTVEITARLDPNMDTKNLCFYSFDSKTQKCTVIKDIEKYSVDKKGQYVTFKTKTAGNIVISSGKLKNK